MYSTRQTNCLRIAHIAPQLDIGGLERLLVEFASWGNRERFELYFVSLGTRGSLAGDIERKGWPVAALNMASGVRLSVIWQLARHLRSNRIDVVHTHNTKSLCYGAPAAKLARVRRVIHTRHGQNYGFSHRQIRLFRHACRLASNVVCVSQDTARMSREAGVSRSKIVTIYNGIDTERFRFVGGQPRGPLVTVGRLSAEKNYQLVIRALQVACKVEPGLRLEVIGDGPCRQELERLARSLDIADYVTFLGETRNVEHRLGQASVFILPSLTEGVSLTLLEAMAVGLPAIATDVGGNVEVVADQITGIIVPSNDVGRLAEAILHLWRNPALAREMGGAGRRRASERYDVRRMLAQYEELYAAPDR